MRIKIFIGLFFYSFILSAQVSKPIDSYEIFDNVAKLTKESKYEEIIQELDKIDRNDSNYVASLLEKSVYYIQLKKYDEASKVCLQGLNSKSNYRHKFFINHAVALKLLNKNEEALKVVEEGLKIYPNNNILWYNKGNIYTNMGKHAEALELYKKSLLLNPFYPNCHLSLGLIALEEGKISQAMLSLNMFLILEPTTNRSLGVLKKLDEAVSSKYERKPNNIALSSEGDDFSDLDLIITNYAALAKNYKIPLKLELPLAKQNFALLSKLEYDKNDKGFWMQTYVPFFKALYTENKYTDFTCYTLQSSGTEYHQALIKKNKDGIIKFKDWAELKVYDIQEIRITNWNDKKLEVTFKYNSSNKLLESVGAVNTAGKEYGYYEFYQNNGSMRANGNYNNDGEKEGLWKYFHYNGALHQEVNYNAGKEDGKFKVYFEDGVLKKEGTFAIGQYEGIENQYNAAGILISKSNFKNNIYNGELLINHNFSSNSKKFQGKYLNGELHDTLYEFYDNGKIKKLKIMLNGKKNGAEVDYYRNGKIHTESINQNDMRNGNYKIYYENGKLKEEGKYIGDIITGTFKSYHSNGTLEDEGMYNEKGKAEGIRKFYDTDGKIYNELEYQKDQIVAYKYYQKDGKIIKEDRRKKSSFKYTGFYPNGSLKLDGIYTENGKSGIWKYYDEYGTLSTEENFNATGELEGQIKNYYPSGTIKDITEYKNGLEDGYYVMYHENGKKKSEGYMVKGAAQGYWQYYNGDEIMETKKYYSAGQLHGYQQYFSCNGVLNNEEFYEGGLKTKFICYDTLNSIVQEILLPNGTGEYKLYYNNKTAKVKGQYVYGLQHGEFKWYHYNGKLSLIGLYHNDEEIGVWKWYTEAGVLITEGNYENGKKNGKWTYYYPNGKLKQTTFYQNNKVQGEQIWYHENGQVDVNKSYIDNEEEGKAYSYDENGELQILRYFQKGVLVGYSYYDNNAQLVPTINITSGNYKILTYFKNGKKAREYEVANGQYHNTYSEYNSNGVLCEMLNYKYGEYEGKSLKYYANNILKSEEYYSNGELNGKCKYYYPNGLIEKELNYKWGYLHGKAMHYTNNGALTLTQTYYSGIVLKEK